MSFNPFDITGKNILITGAASGMGQQTAVECSKLGANLILFDLNEEGLKETLSQMERPEAHYYAVVDLTDFDKVPEEVTKAVEKIGRIDGLVNFAGISTTLPLKMATPELLDKFYRINVYSAYFLTKEVVKKANFSKDGGCIIFISSVAASFGSAGKSIYSMTKASLLGIARSLANEFSSRKIRFNAISPGVIVTNINRNQPYIKDPVMRKEIEDQHFLGLGETSDIANACIYLLSDAARWVTGANMFVDGGYSAKK